MNIYDRFFNQMKIQLTALPHSFKYTVSDYSINGTNKSINYLAKYILAWSKNINSKGLLSSSLIVSDHHHSAMERAAAGFRPILTSQLQKQNQCRGQSRTGSVHWGQTREHAHTRPVKCPDGLNTAQHGPARPHLLSISSLLDVRWCFGPSSGLYFGCAASWCLSDGSL